MQTAIQNYVELAGCCVDALCHTPQNPPHFQTWSLLHSVYFLDRYSIAYPVPVPRDLQLRLAVKHGAKKPDSDLIFLLVCLENEEHQLI
jgi:hypothetical protein